MHLNTCPVHCCVSTSYGLEHYKFLPSSLFSVKVHYIPDQLADAHSAVLILPQDIDLRAPQ
jgi:hypothetical protein